MKKSMLLLAFATMIGTGAVNAQADPQPAKAQHQGNGKGNGKQNKPSPEEQAGRQAAHMQKKLGLSDDQKAKIQEFALTRIKANQEVKDKARASKNEGDRKAYGQQMKANKETFENSVNGVLTPEQQAKWKEMKDDHKDQAGDDSQGDNKGNTDGKGNGKDKGDGKTQGNANGKGDKSNSQEDKKLQKDKHEGKHHGGDKQEATEQN